MPRSPVKIVKKLIARTRLNALIRSLRRKEQKIVFTNGVFDILHRGHVDYLTKAKSYGDVLIVGLNSDASARRLKGPDRPLQKQSDRAAVLAALEVVDYVVVFSSDTPEKLILQVRPDVLVKGADYAIDEIVGADYVRSYGGKVRRVRVTKGRSTSTIIERIESSGRDKP
ncbi:D-glycero-beta-D-manno-heptose 1-phosphate adenylyltransferase [candidate division GN15 bacterium]|nr:D-glycero-beta-D-manno-heptose 1-phosphate adenylyltransferase [candidate division GN15 bacterium]